MPASVIRTAISLTAAITFFGLAAPETSAELCPSGLGDSAKSFIQTNGAINSVEVTAPTAHLPGLPSECVEKFARELSQSGGQFDTVLVYYGSGAKSTGHFNTANYWVRFAEDWQAALVVANALPGNMSAIQFYHLGRGRYDEPRPTSDTTIEMLDNGWVIEMVQETREGAY